jgi:Ner family transcriptional regulator
MSTFMLPIDEPAPLDAAARREWIKYRLRLAGYSLGRLAIENGLHRNVTVRALWGPYPKMERLIAEKLGVHPRQIWPERYGPDGRSNRPMGRPKHASTVNTHARPARNAKDHKEE